jgi:hypothetical protein
MASLGTFVAGDYLYKKQTAGVAVVGHMLSIPVRLFRITRHPLETVETLLLGVLSRRVAATYQAPYASSFWDETGR